MGILRAIFAVSVVFSHSWPTGLMFVGGRNAVQLFYIISGFLISYVLLDTKSYKNISTFYINRYLRLYPIYLCVAILTFVFLLLTKQNDLLDFYEKIPKGATILLVFSNIFLFGQDWVMFSGIENNHLIFTPDFSDSEVILYKGLLVPQAWTLGVELSFYVLAPFILRKKSTIFCLLFLSLAIRLYLLKIGVGNKDPWTYRFFPTELALFLLGALAHQILLPFYKQFKPEKLKIISTFATYFLIFLSLTYFLIPLKEIYKTALLFVFFLTLLPFTFIFQNNSSLDRHIGNLSYPIYINHMLIIWLITFFTEIIGVDNRYILSISSVFITIIFAIILNKFLGVPLEKIRNAIKIKNSLSRGSHH